MVPGGVYRAVLLGVAVLVDAVDVYGHFLDAAGLVDYFFDAVAGVVVLVVGPKGGGAAAGLALVEDELVGVVPREVAVGVFTGLVACGVVRIRVGVRPDGKPGQAVVGLGGGVFEVPREIVAGMAVGLVPEFLDVAQFVVRVSACVGVGGGGVFGPGI